MQQWMNRAALREPKLSRRYFLAAAAAGTTGLVVGCSSREEPVARTDGEADAASDSTVVENMNAFVRIGSDDSVTVVLKHLDKGQGVSTGLPTIVAEELDADWGQMRTEFAPADVERYANSMFGIQGTGGSTAIANSWMQLRKAAAGARAMLVAAAAKEWQVPEGEITVSGGTIRHTASDRSSGFGAFVSAAALQRAPDEPTLKRPDQFTLVGSRQWRLDSADKTDGTAQFTIDVSRPGMKVAVMAHPPRFGATVASVDSTAAEAMDGVHGVYAIPRGVAVVADSFWTARKARDVLAIEWDESAAERRGTDQILADFKALAQSSDVPVARDDGNAERALGESTEAVEFHFELPFLAHATMEPMDCVVELADGRCDVWTGSQIQTLDQQGAAAAAGVPPSKVFVHTQYAGGSFGRRAAPDSDFVVEAVQIAKASGGEFPVKLIWTRENDMVAGRYRPMGYHVVRAGIGSDGRPNAWHHRVVTQSFMVGTPFEGMVRNGIDNSSVEGAATLPYAIENLKVDLKLAEVGVPTLWWRSVGHTHNGWVTEVMIDQLAHLANSDPVDYRLALLGDHPRHAGVLRLAAEKAGWNESAPDGVARGVAVHESFGSVVAQVAEVRVTEGKLTVERVVAAVDCGIAINPDVIEAQVEGAIGMGLGAFLREAMHLDEGVVRDQNFHLYKPLRISEMPMVEVHIVPSDKRPTGIGEPGLPPIAPAVTNAIFAATGRLITKLPLADQLSNA